MNASTALSARHEQWNSGEIIVDLLNGGHTRFVVEDLRQRVGPRQVSLLHVRLVNCCKTLVLNAHHARSMLSLQAPVSRYPGCASGINSRSHGLNVTFDDRHG